MLTDIAYRQQTFRPNDTAGQLQSLEDDGFALITGLLPAEMVEKARQEIDRLQPIHWDSQGSNDHYKCIFNRDAFWVPFLDWPGVVELAEAALKENCHVIGQTAWRTHPGHRGVGVHLDYLVAEVPEDMMSDRRLVLPMQICTAHFYLSDITAELCPTHVIPGSHRAGRKPRRGETDWNGLKPDPVLCKAGDVLFFRSELWHSGSDNTTADSTRYLLQVHYGRNTIAQKFSPCISWQFNPAILQVCTPRQLRLLGDRKKGAYD